MVEVSTPRKWLLRLLAIGYVFFLVAWPVSLIVARDLRGRLHHAVRHPERPDVPERADAHGVGRLLGGRDQHVFGVGISLLLVRYEFPGKRALSALIDVPLSVSPVVVGLALLLVYNGRTGWFGPTLESWGYQIIFAAPGMIMATCFVALPLVIRESPPRIRFTAHAGRRGRRRFDIKTRHHAPLSGRLDHRRRPQS